MTADQKNTIYDNLVKSTTSLSGLTLETLKHSLKALGKEQDDEVQLYLMDLIDNCYYQNEKVISMFQKLLEIRDKFFNK